MHVSFFALTALFLTLHDSLAATGEDLNFRSEEIIDRLTGLDKNEKFLSYIPIGGFGNQIMGFRNALRLAGLLNRTLIVPPLLAHGEHEIGTCHNNHIMSPNGAGFNFWYYKKQKLASASYLSIADIVDISVVNPNLVRTIDMRLFAALTCGIDISVSLSYCAWCSPLLERLKKHREINFPQNLSLKDRLHFCGIQFGYLDQSFLPSNRVKFSVYREQRDCKSTVFMYLRDTEGKLIEGRRNKSTMWKTCPGKQLAQRDWYNVEYILAKKKEAGLKPVEYVNVVRYFGSEESKARKAHVLAIGNTFDLFDFQLPTGDRFGDDLSCATQYLGFNPAITEAAEAFTKEKFPEPFACVHFRAGDGIFAKIKNSTLRKIKHWLNAKELSLASAPGSHVLRTFLMSDLNTPEWTEKIRTSLNVSDIVFSAQLKQIEQQVRKKAFALGHGLLTNRVNVVDMATLREAHWDVEVEERVLNISSAKGSVLVYIEQSVCSCSRRGLFGSVFSTLAANIRQLIDGRVCHIL